MGDLDTGSTHAQCSLVAFMEILNIVPFNMGRFVQIDLLDLFFFFCF